jgi:trk system potassium uptake protein TrkH
MPNATPSQLPHFWKMFQSALAVARAVALVLGGAALIAQYALALPVDDLYLHRVTVLVAAVLIFDIISRVGLLSDPRKHIQRSTYIIGATVVMTLAGIIAQSESGAADWLPQSRFLLAAQAFVLACALPALIAMFRCANAGGKFVRLGALAGAAALLLHYGWPDPLVDEWKLLALEGLCVGVFVIAWLARLAKQRTQFFRRNWLESVLAAAGLAFGAASGQWLTVLWAACLYVIVAAAAETLGAAIKATDLELCGQGVHPFWLLAGVVLALVVVGAAVLYAQASVSADRDATPGQNPMPADDAVFVSISAVTCTGLPLRDLVTDFTLVGQASIFVLMQCGGLATMLFGVLFVAMLARDLEEPSLRPRPAWQGFASMAQFVIGASLILELIGAVMLYPMFARMPLGAAGGLLGDSPGKTAWYAAFHSVSAYCNAGLVLCDVRSLREQWQVLGVLAPLVVVGGVGMFVIRDVLEYLQAAAQRLRDRSLPRPQLSLHSKLVLSATMLLVIGGGSVLILIEQQATREHSQLDRGHMGQRGPGEWQSLDRRQKLSAGLMEAVAARSGGMGTIVSDDISDAGKMWMSALMLAGTSPGGAGGGMKLMPLIAMVLAAWAVLRRRSGVEAYDRVLSGGVVLRLLAAFGMYLLLGMAVAIALALSARGFGLSEVLFESASAFGNCGLSTGLTRASPLEGKLVLAAAMLVGRLAPLAMLAALPQRAKA